MSIEFLSAKKISQNSVLVSYNIDNDQFDDVDFSVEWSNIHAGTGEEISFYLNENAVFSKDQVLAEKVARSIKSGESDANTDLDMYLFVRDTFDQSDAQSLSELPQLDQDATKQEVIEFGVKHGWEIDGNFHDNRIMACKPLGTCDFPYFELKTLIDDINQGICWDFDNWIEQRLLSKRAEKIEQAAKPKAAQERQALNEKIAHYTPAAVLNQFGHVVAQCTAEPKARTIQVCALLPNGQPFNVSEMKISRSKKNLSVAEKTMTSYAVTFFSNEPFYS